MLKVGKTDKKHDEHKDGDESSQQALLSDKGITDVFIDSQVALDLYSCGYLHNSSM